MSKRRVIYCISDLQIPAEHIDALPFVLHLIKTFRKPGDDELFINLGDEIDCHALGKWPANPNGRSAGDELQESIHRLKDWYREFPKMRVCVSNHTWRPYKKAFLNGIPKEFMRSIGEVLEAPIGWQWADKWVIDGVCFEHGENVSGPPAALTAALQNRMPTAIGHQHSHAGVIFSASPNDQIWGMNTGCLIDVDQYNFDYGKNLRKKPTLGMGIIIDQIPFFIPMILDKRKRWIKRII